MGRGAEEREAQRSSSSSISMMSPSSDFRRAFASAGRANWSVRISAKDPFILAYYRSAWSVSARSARSPDERGEDERADDERADGEHADGERGEGELVGSH